MHPARRRLTVLSAAIAVIAALLAVLLPATLASAASAPVAGTRVGASHPGMILTVGVSRPVCAGDRRCETAPQPGFAAGLCVAAEEGGAATRVFWTGGDAAKSAATKFAVENGGGTIGMTARGQAVANATEGMPWAQARPLWEAVSQNFAQGASGEAHVFINVELANPESLSARIELPALVGNTNVPDVIFHLIGG